MIVFVAVCIILIHACELVFHIWCCNNLQEEALAVEKERGLLTTLPKGLSEKEVKEFGQCMIEINPGLVVKPRRWNEKRVHFVYFTGATSGYTIRVGRDVIDVVPKKSIQIAPELGVECLRRLAGEGHFKKAIEAKLKPQKEKDASNNIIDSLPSPRCNMGAAKSEPSPDSQKTDRKLLENELGRVQICPPHVGFPSHFCSHPVQFDTVNPMRSPTSSMRETILEGRRRHDVVVKPNIQVLLPSLDASNGLWAAVEKQLGVDIPRMIWEAFQFIPWFFIAYDYNAFLRRVWRSPAWMPTIYIRLGCPPKYVIFVFWGAFFDHQNFGRTALYQRLLFGYILHMLAAERPIAAYENGRQPRRHRRFRRNMQE